MNVSPTGHPYGLVTDDPRRECRRRIDYQDDWSGWTQRRRSYGVCALGKLE
jgi:hypothetical protein